MLGTRVVVRTKVSDDYADAGIEDTTIYIVPPTNDRAVIRRAIGQYVRTMNDCTVVGILRYTEEGMEFTPDFYVHRCDHDGRWVD